MQQKLMTGLMAVVFGLAMVGEASVSLTNAGFEDPVLADGMWTSSVNGWTQAGGASYVIAQGNLFNSTAGGPMPAPASGRQVAQVNASGVLWQAGGTIESNRLYTLTVAVGLANVWGAGTSVVKVSAGTSFSGRTLLETKTISSPAAKTFVDVTLQFHTYGTYAALMGQTLYVELSNSSSSVAFDNVRLTETQEPFSPFVNNGDFEYPSLTAGGWQSGATGWTPNGASVYTIAQAQYSGGTAGGPYPAPATGRQVLQVNQGFTAYQDLGVIQSNKTHTLTVAVGRESSFTWDASCTISLMEDAWNSSVPLALSTGVAPQGSFTNVSLTFSTAKAYWGDKVGHRLIVALKSSYSTVFFDNVTLTLSDPPAIALENAGFEQPAVARGSFSTTSSSWVGINTAGVIAYTNWVGGTQGSPMPAPADGRQAAFLNSGSYLYQDTVRIESNRIYTLTVAQGTGDAPAMGPYTGSIYLRDNAWDGAVLAVTTVASPPVGTFVDRTISFATTNGLHSDAVGHLLYVTLYGTGAQSVYDNVRFSVQRPASISLSATPAYTNLATGGTVIVTGPQSSETDGLTTNAATGSVVLSQAVPAPTYVMLWLTGGDVGKYSALAAALNTGGVTALTVADPDWVQLAKRYSGFNMLVKFPGQSNTALNWDFGFGYEWDSAVVDQVAVSTKPVVGTLIIVY